MFKQIAFKPCDFVAIALAAGVTALSVVLVYSGAGARPFVKVSGGVSGANKAADTWLLPLDSAAAQRISVPGPLGSTVIEVTDHAARVVYSPCANQMCVAAGAIHRQGQWVACLPNQTLLSIEGGAGEDDAPDAVVW
ncbi:MAG: NusG domain II-containing protein [Treponema sp.]|jgi:hypothetical protein|nr:NusG domain II-containing protein [Treponema sp.]